MPSSQAIPVGDRALDALRALGRPQAVMFDLDGTLIDSVEDIHHATNLLLDELGLERRSRDEIATWVGNGARMLVERSIAGRLAGFAGRADAETQHALADAAMPRFRAIYEEICADHTAPLDGAHASLEVCKSLGIPVAVVTNKPLAPTERIIEALGWRSLVGAVLGGDSMSVRKPDPAPLLEALRRLDCPTGWMVGDSANDVGAARAARLPCIVVRGGYNHGHPVESLDPAPDLILDSLVSFADALRTIA